MRTSFKVPVSAREEDWPSRLGSEREFAEKNQSKFWHAHGGGVLRLLRSEEMLETI